MLVMIMGLPGTGKSTFASQLAQEIDAVHINSDQVRHASRKRGQYDYATKLSVYQDMKDLMLKALNTGKHVILDATFFQIALRKLFTETIRAYHCPVQYIEMQANEEDLKVRLQQSRKYSEAGQQAYETVKSMFEPIEYDHLTLNSSEMSMDTMLEEAIRYLKQHDTSTNPASHIGY